MEIRHCLSCGDSLKGRSDKKFCNDYCRNNFNNQRKSLDKQNSVIKAVNSILLKNRKILESVLPSGDERIKVFGDKLIRLGFQFNYITNVNRHDANQTYFCCYDYGYYPADNNCYIVLKVKEDPV